MNLVLKNLSFYIVLCELYLKVVQGVRLYEKNNTDSYLTSLQIIRKYGYPAEAHTTRTQDGYILELHRIPHGKNSNSNSHSQKPPIFFQHGLLGSSADFLLIGPEKALPFLLADKGYDIWLGNIRGNTYSRGHETLTPEDVSFWNFSWHESGLNDIPAQIDFICNYTQHDNLIYLGYSMGTTEFFVLTSTKPEYQEKIRGAILFAAVAYVENTKTPLRLLAPFANNIQVLSNLLTDGEFIQQSTLLRYFIRLACTLNTFERNLCRNIVFLVTGCDPFQFNETLIPNIFNHLPAGASTKSITHYAQLIQSGQFRQFDYGPQQNMVRYHSSKPPGYNLEGINVPLYIFEGANDFLSTKEDISRLVKRLPNVKSLKVVDYPLFNHLDFVLADDVKVLLYESVMDVINNIANDVETETECTDCEYDDAK